MGDRCTHIMSNGEGCRAFALKGNSLCFMHAPENSERRKAAQREGGKRHVQLSNNMIRIKRGKIKNVMSFLANTVTEVRNCRQSSKVYQI